MMAKHFRQIETFLDIPKLSQLFPPPEQYPYFNGGDTFPFQPHAQSHSPINAWWLAEFSLMAYEDPERIHNLLINKEFISARSVSWFASKNDMLTSSNTQGFIAETPDYAVIAFRGTEFSRPGDVLQEPAKLLNIFQDLKTDLEIPPKADEAGKPPFAVPVHTGFAKALQSVWEQLQAPLRAIGSKPVWLTGHSLGGALASLMAYQLGGGKVAGVYTFGAPCVGTGGFVQAYSARGLEAKTFRYVHGIDAVPQLLEHWPLVERRTLTHYEHAGRELKLDAGERRGRIGQIWNRALDLSLGLDQLDYAPIFYAYETWNVIPE